MLMAPTETVKPRLKSKIFPSLWNTSIRHDPLFLPSAAKYTASISFTYVVEFWSCVDIAMLNSIAHSCKSLRRKSLQILFRRGNIFEAFFNHTCRLTVDFCGNAFVYAMSKHKICSVWMGYVHFIIFAGTITIEVYYVTGNTHSNAVLWIVMKRLNREFVCHLNSVGNASNSPTSSVWFIYTGVYM